MLISIIVPNYNHAAYLPQRMDAILKQTYSHFEIILLDDCSTDNSKAVLEQYRSHPKVSSIVYNEENSGSPFRQWQRGIEKAKGSWIWIAESDDYCRPELLEVLVQNIKTCSRAVLSYCQSYEADERGNITGDMSFHTDILSPQRWKEDYCNEGKEEIKNFLLYRNTIPNASAVLFEKKAFEVVGEQYTNMRFCGDWLLWVQLLKRGNIAYNAQPLNFFRKHSATTRVLDTRDKERARTEEEYAVATDIETWLGCTAPVQNRLRQLAKEYLALFTRSERLRLLLNPFAYIGSIPFSTLWTEYLREKREKPT